MALMDMPCPHCAAVLDIPPSMANSQAACPKCEGWFAVGSIAVEPPPLPMPQTYQAPRVARPVRQSPVRAALLWAICAWTAICGIRLAWLAVDYLPHVGSPVEGFAWSNLRNAAVLALFVYAVPMIAMLVGYTAAKAE